VDNLRRQRRRDNLAGVSDALRLTVRYSDGGDGWVMAQVKEVPGAMSQGHTRDEARTNVVDALRLMLKPEPDEPADPGREALRLLLAS
jgi:predicted RNase H-like HicB family nuclease